MRRRVAERLKKEKRVEIKKIVKMYKWGALVTFRYL